MRQTGFPVGSPAADGGVYLEVRYDNPPTIFVRNLGGDAGISVGLPTFIRITFRIFSFGIWGGKVKIRSDCERFYKDNLPNIFVRYLGGN